MKIVCLVSVLSLVLMISTGFMFEPKDHAISKDIVAIIKEVLLLKEKQQHDKALMILVNALAHEPDDSLLRSILLQQFDLFLEEEVRHAEFKIQENPHHISSYQRMSESLDLLGDRSRAMEVLLIGISKNIAAYELWMSIATLELKAGRAMEALDVFKEVIRLNPRYADAYNNAAYILSHQENYHKRDLTKAEAWAHKAISLDPKNAHYFDTLAEIKFKQGLVQQALQFINKAIKLAPKELYFKDQLVRFQGYSFIKAQ